MLARGKAWGVWWVAAGLGLAFCACAGHGTALDEDGGEVERLTAYVHVIVDKSSTAVFASTTFRADDGWLRFEHMRDAMGQAAHDYDARLGLGISVAPKSYAAGDGCGPVLIDTPRPQSSIVLQAALGAGGGFGGGAPLAAALEEAKDALTATTFERPVYVLLLTAGAPSCGTATGGTCRCTAYNGDGPIPDSCSRSDRNCLDDDRTVAAVRALHDAGIKTVVIGYAGTPFEDVLDELASAGVGTDAKARMAGFDDLEDKIREAFADIADGRVL